MYELYIGNKNYSSWSLRPWVLLKALDIPFEEYLVPFHDENAWADYRKRAPNALVPMLLDGDLKVWDSLAIAEYLAENHEGVWPTDKAARAFARSAAAEMHSGFTALRTICGMNVGVRVKLADKHLEALLPNLGRLSLLWNEGISRFGGPFLAGKNFSAADAFFCPVAFRVQTYDLQLNEACMDYVRTLLELPAMQQWYQEGIAETFRDLPHDAEIDEIGELVIDHRAQA